MGDQDDFWKVFESAGDCGEGIWFGEINCRGSVLV